MIVVTGSTGTFGSAILKKLQERKITAKAATRVDLNWNKPETFEKALEGVEKVFLISPPNFTGFDLKITPFIKEAKKANVKFILFSTVYGIDKIQGSTLAKAEKVVSESGIDYTIVRPNFLFQNFINYDIQAIKNGRIYLPTKNSKTSYIDVNDVANASVALDFRIGSP